MYTTKRGMFQLNYKDGVMKDGSIVARKITVLHDTGAYAGMGPYAVEKNSILAAGPYNIPNISYDGTCVFTNRVPCSSMRGFAVINGTAAVELQMDKLAEAISMNPWEFRMMNAWRNGDLSATQVKIEACAAVEVMQRAADLAGIELPQHLKTMSSDRR